MGINLVWLVLLISLSSILQCWFTDAGIRMLKRYAWLRFKQWLSTLIFCPLVIANFLGVFYIVALTVRSSLPPNTRLPEKQAWIFYGLAALWCLPQVGWFIARGWRLMRDFPPGPPAGKTQRRWWT
jgi:hypothetical protein